MSEELTLAQRIKVRAATGIPMVMDPETMRALATMIDAQDEAMTVAGETIDTISQAAERAMHRSLTILAASVGFCLTGLVFWVLS
jgi:sialic acid synthase SpsE